MHFTHTWQTQSKTHQKTSSSVFPLFLQKQILDVKILLLCTLIFHAGSSPSLSSAASHLSNTQLLSVCQPYVPVRTAVNHIGTVFPVVKLASIGPRHARSQFGLVHWEDAEPGSFAHGVNTILVLPVWPDSSQPWTLAAWTTGLTC